MAFADAFIFLAAVTLLLTPLVLFLPANPNKRTSRTARKRSVDTSYRQDRYLPRACPKRKRRSYKIGAS